MKYVKNIDFEYKEDIKKLFIEITDKECFLFEDVYVLIENYRKKVDVIEIWAIDGKSVKLSLDSKKAGAYDIQNILEKLI